MRETQFNAESRDHAAPCIRPLSLFRFGILFLFLLLRRPFGVPFAKPIPLLLFEHRVDKGKAKRTRTPARRETPSESHSASFSDFPWDMRTAQPRRPYPPYPAGGISPVGDGRGGYSAATRVSSRSMIYFIALFESGIIPGRSAASYLPPSQPRAPGPTRGDVRTGVSPTGRSTGTGRSLPRRRHPRWQDRNDELARFCLFLSLSRSLAALACRKVVKIPVSSSRV